MKTSGPFAQYPSLSNVLVLISGGASGIGAAMVEQFSAQGSKVAFIDIAQESAIKLVERISPEAAHAPIFLHCDLTDIAALRRTIEKIQAQLGPIRVLVNNAANDDRHKFPEVTPEFWDESMNVNLRHQFFATQAVVPGMTHAGGGSIINLSSIAWMIPSTGLPAYVTAKAGIVGLTRTLSHELGGANIRVNCVSPGAVMTERQRRLWMTKEYLAEVMQKQSLKRQMNPDDVARLVLFLPSDDSSATTGQNFVIDCSWV
jgi:NAD(P)-dependent dehydrogenase (short-subunit alcohol dehydrogenase family)